MKRSDMVLFWLYKRIKPLYLKLENYVLAQIRKALLEENIKLAEQKLKAFHERLTSQKFAELITRPPQENCSHLKGGKWRNRASYKDYAVIMHTFPDAHQEIKCMICGKTWTKSSSDWKQAIEMTRNSSNCPSSSGILAETFKWI